MLIFNSTGGQHSHPHIDRGLVVLYLTLLGTLQKTSFAGPTTAEVSALGQIGGRGQVEENDMSDRGT